MGRSIASQANLMGIIASLPYASLNGASPVEVLTVVVYTQKMLGSSSGHIPFAPSSWVLIIFHKDQFETSAYSLACEWEGEE